MGGKRSRRFVITGQSKCPCTDYIALKQHFRFARDGLCWGHGHEGSAIALRRRTIELRGEDGGVCQGRNDTCLSAAARATSISLASLFAIASAKELKSWTTSKKALGPPITFCR